MTDIDFIKAVEREMKECEAHAIENLGDKFAIWFAAKFLDLEIGEVVNKFHIGSAGDEKTDLGIIDDRFPTKMIIQCKYSKDPLKKTFGKNEVEEVLNAKRRIDTSPDDGNERKRQFAQDFKGSKLPEKLIVVGFGEFTALPHNNAYEYARKNDVQIYDFERLKKEYIRIIDPTAIKKPEEVELEMKSDRFFSFSEGHTKAHFMVTPALKIYEIVKDKGDGIFEENLRYQLPKASVSSLISNEIKRTIEKEPLDLVILNNGITFICEKVEESRGKLKLIKPQIINGCQTAYTIFETYEALSKSGASIESNSYLPIKIIETSVIDARIIQKISRAANLQNPITPRNRFSNDELQIELKSALGNLEKPIFYNHKDGSWETILRTKKQSLFKVKGKSYRTMDNQLIGQIYLSLLGKPQLAGNQKGIIFSDEKYYNAIFNYKLPAPERFEQIGIAVADAKLESGEKKFIDDILFGYRVYKFLDAIELILYPKKKELYKDDEKDPTYEYFKKIVTKEFVTYWHFHAVRLFHEIIYTKADGDSKQIETIRKKLVGDEVDLFFGSIKNIAQKLNIEEKLQRYTILNISNPSQEFPLLGKWISSLEQVVYDIVAPEKEKPEWKSFNQFFYKREKTLIDIRQKVTDILGGADSDLKFPL